MVKIDPNATDTSSSSPTSPSLEPPPTRRRRLPYVVIGVVAVLAFGAVGGYMWLNAGVEKTDDARVAADLAPIASGVPGQIARVLVADNQAVQRGEVIAEIDPTEYAARRARAQAELAAATADARAADAQVAAMEAELRGGQTTTQALRSGTAATVGAAKASVAAAEAAVDSARVDLKKATHDFKRASSLHESGSVSEQDLEYARIARDSARAALASAKAKRSIAVYDRIVAEAHETDAVGRENRDRALAAQLDAARAKAEVMHARVAAAQSEVDLSEHLLSLTKIRAPAAGKACRLTAREGQVVAVGQAIGVLVPSETYVVANFKETQVERMKPGQLAVIELDAYPGRDFSGTVDSLSGGVASSFALLPADNASGNYVKVVQRVPVRILWEPPDDVVVRAGLSAEVAIYVGD